MSNTRTECEAEFVKIFESLDRSNITLLNEAIRHSLWLQGLKSSPRYIPDQQQPNCEKEEYSQQ
jgi:hypothetical protein